MPLTKLQQYLDENNIHYMRITHSPAYTAQGIAALAHISGKELAKTVVLKIDGVLALAVLPASSQIDLRKIKSAVGAETAVLASEAEFKDKFPDCETGAMPPFGNLYDMAVYVEESLSKDQEIAFNAGSHRDLIRMAYVDFQRLVNPLVVQFASTKPAKAAA